MHPFRSLLAQLSQARSKRISEKTRAAYVNAWKNNQLSTLTFQVNDAQADAGGSLRVQMNCQVNNSKIRTVTRNGREHIVVPSFTLPFGCTMNRGFYPEEEIRKAYKSLEGTLAPAGHPVVNGEYVAAGTVEAINAFHIGGWNESVRLEGNRVAVDKIIDVEYAKQTEKGRAVLEAINKGEPIHTSTGIFLEREMAPNAKGYEWIARNMLIDHDAILIGEIGAATPAEGVGMMVNVADAVEPPAELTANEKSLLDRFALFLKMGLNSQASSTPPQSSQDADMTLEELKAALAESQAATVNAVQETIGKPLGDRLTALENNHKSLADSLTANERAKEAEKRAAVTAKFGEVVANSVSGEALDALFAQTQGTAPALSGVHTNSQQHAGYQVPE